MLGEELVDDGLVATGRLKDVEGKTNSPPAKTVSMLYRGTAKSSRARRYFVDRWAWNGCDNWKFEDFPAEFLADLVPAMIRVRGGPKDDTTRPWLLDATQYYSDRKGS